MRFLVLPCPPEATKQTVFSIFSATPDSPWRGSSVWRNRSPVRPSRRFIPREVAEERAPPDILAKRERDRSFQRDSVPQ